MPLGCYPGMNFEKFFKFRGISLAEIVFAIGIIAFVILILIGTLTGGLQALQKGTGYSYATVLAKKTIEQYKALEYASVPVYEPDSPDITTDGPFKISTTVEEKTYEDTTFVFKKVTVEVTRGKDGLKVKEVRVVMEIMLIP